MTIERARRGSFRFRIEGGSYLVNEPVISADRIAIPPWAGVYAADTCKGGGAAPCWRYGFDVSLVDDGFQALVSVDGPATTERLVARGEDGMLAGGNSVLFLTFVRAAAGDAHTGPSRNDQSTGKLVRRKDGSLWVELNGLPGPTGVREVPLSVQPKP
jgi:hypothetical protein